MSQSRQLAAIMFTDIVGYTALMGEDEQKAFDLLRKNRQIQKPIIEKFNGTWIKEIGDGILASFHTVTDAVLCASEIQNACNDIDDLKLRIGIHLGEVVFEDMDVFGDGVNIASRLQALAPIGGTWISESIYKNVSNKKEIKTKFIREEILKNVKEPVRIYEVITDHKTEVPRSTPEKHSAKEFPEKSIAVLPFVNMSNDPEQEYFSDGMAEEILNTLVHLKDLKVAGRTSSFQFKGKNIDIQEVGEKLHVRTVLEGSVRRQGNRLRITVQLVNVEDGYHLCSERYDREMDDIFAIQDEIASQIAEHLKLTFFGNYETKEEKKPTNNMEAYEMLLRGRFYLEKRVEGIEKALEYFKEALKLDPMFSDANFYLGSTYFFAAWYLFIPFIEGFEKSREYLKKTLILDHNHDEAHLMLAFVYYFHDWNWNKAEEEYKKVNPNHRFLTYNIKFEPWFKAFVYGDFDYAITEMEKQVALEPHNIDNQMYLAQFYFYARRYPKSRDIASKLLKENPTYSEAYRYLGLSYLFEEKFDEAINNFRKAVEYSQGKGYTTMDLIRGLIRAGIRDEAQQLISDIQKHKKSHLLPPTAWSRIYANLGKMDEAFESLEDAFSKKDFWLISLKYSQDWDIMRADSRFQKVLERMNFPK